MAQRPRSPLTWDEAAGHVARLIEGGTRREIVDQLVAAGPLDGAPGRLRECMRAHVFPVAGGTVSLRRSVDVLDARTRRAGLHVLHGWDFNAQRRPPDIAPVLLLDYCVRTGIAPGRVRDALAILLDEYCAALLALLVVRAWDDGDLDATFLRVDGLAAALAGPGGSGHRIVDDAGTILILAVAYYHPEESAYDALLRQVWKLGDAQALTAARPGAAVLASHLRWGFRFMYRQDVGRMRADNVVDYPWVLFSLVTLMRAWIKSRAAGEPPARRAAVAEALVNGLTPDPWAFTGKIPEFLAEYRGEHDELRAALGRYRDDLVSEFAAFQPAAGVYTPLGFACNFLSNAVVASAVLTVQEQFEHPSLNALLAGEPSHGGETGVAEPFVRRLMQFSSEPARLGAGGAPLIVYDRYDGAHHFNAVVHALGEIKAT